MLDKLISFIAKRVVPKLDKSEYARGSFGLYSILIKQSLSCSAISLIAFISSSHIFL